MLFLLLSVICSILIYQKFIKPCNYWKRKGIKCVKAWPLVGNIGKAFLKREPYVNVGVNLYNNFPDDRYVGYMHFMKRYLLIRDIDLIKQIAVKNYDHFIDHPNNFGQCSENDILLNKSLVYLTGEKWKELRAFLNPVFTTNNIKNMYNLIDESAENFVKCFEGEAELDMKRIFSRFSCNVIASTAFGTKIDCFKELQNEFWVLGPRLSRLSFSQTIKLMIMQMSQRITRLFRIQLSSRRAIKFFRSVIKDNIQKKENEDRVRPDLVYLLSEARKGKLIGDNKTEKMVGFAAPQESEIEPSAKEIEFTDDHIVAQAMFFFVAGFDTVSTSCSFMAYELALNPDIQKKLQEEIDSVRSKYPGKITYDSLVSMKYLDQVVSETLRLWPVGFETDRLCIKDYLIEAQKPHEKALLLQKGVVALIPIMAIHRDPDYFPEPNRFDPERFNDANKSKIIPGSYMPFGVGPRNCIGSKFALLEMKTLFCHLLSKFDIVPIGKTEIPIRIDRKSWNLQPTTGFWLGFKPRKESFC